MTITRIASLYSLPTLALLACAAAGDAGEPPPRKYSNVERLPLARLAAVHDDVERLRPRRVTIPPLPGLNSTL